MHDDDLRNQFTAFMQKVVYHAKVDYIRQKKARHANAEIESAETPVLSYEQDFRLEPDAEFDFEEQRLADSFASLPLMRRRILTLLFVQGLTAMEVAEELGCSLDYVYSNKRRALQKLQEQLREGGEQDEE
jgi:RNA polymerase sigma factor (sigma-70 family)